MQPCWVQPPWHGTKATSNQRFRLSNGVVFAYSRADAYLMTSQLPRFFLWTLLSLLSLSGMAQQVRFLNQSDFSPIHNVVVVDSESEQFQLSDEQGNVPISFFSKNRRYITRHPSYKSAELFFDQIPNQDYIVYLAIEAVNIDEVVISAIKWQQPKSEVPNEVLSISSNQMKFSNAQTSADVLESSGQVFVQRSQMGGGSPMIRGFAANSVIIVIDGVRMNNAIYRSGNLHNVVSLDPNMLESSEVIFGPGSVIYGSDALGGVMAFQTKKPLFSYGKKFGLDADALVRYSSANNEKTANVNLTYGKGRWGFVTGLTSSDFDDLRSGANRNSQYPQFGKRLEYVETSSAGDDIIPNDNVNVQRHSGYSQTNVLQKIGYSAQNTEVIYGLYYSTSSNIPRYDRLILRDETNQLTNAEWFYGPQDFFMHSLNLSQYKSKKMYDAVKATLAHQVVKESRHDK